MNGSKCKSLVTFNIYIKRWGNLLNIFANPNKVNEKIIPREKVSENENI